MARVPQHEGLTTPDAGGGTGQPLLTVLSHPVREMSTTAWLIHSTCEDLQDGDDIADHVYRALQASACWLDRQWSDMHSAGVMG